MSGAGNDFIIIDAMSGSKNFNVKIKPHQIRKLCDRKVVGCDQFIVIRDSDEADCHMEIFNADGSKSDACGNATRCIAAIICDKVAREDVTIRTDAGFLECEKKDSLVSVHIAIPKFGPDFFFDDQKFFTVDVGNPHAINFCNNIPADDHFNEIGSQIECHQFFPNKTNVEFATITASNIIEVRVFERGVGETLACGTGACAVAACAIKNKLVDDNELIVRFRGGDIIINWDGGSDSKIIMTGGYEEVFSAAIEI